MGGSGISTYDNLLASGYRFGVWVHYVVWFALFLSCDQVFSSFLFFVRFFSFIHMLSSPVGDIFRRGELLCSELLLLRIRLLHFKVSLRGSEPIVM
jgi:hypothetical protein